MKKFLVLLMAPVAAFDEFLKNTSPENNQKFMDDWNKWMEAHKGAVVDAGAPLGKNKRVEDGGVSDTRNEVGGYMLVQANSQDEAAALLKDNPHLKQVPGAYIDVLECLEIPGM